MENINNNKFKIDYNQLLDYFKRKDYNSYNDKELELLTEIFKYSGYNIDFLKKNKNINLK
jgi:hypothetical protein